MAGEGDEAVPIGGHALAKLRVIKVVDKCRRGDFEGGAANLDHGAKAGAGLKDRQAGHTLVADDGGRNALAIGDLGDD